MSRVLRVCALTGAHGYVGSALRRGLTAAGWTVVSLSRREKLAADEIRWSLEDALCFGAKFSSRRAAAPPGIGSGARRLGPAPGAPP